MGKVLLAGSIKSKPTPKQRPKLTKSGRAYNPQKTKDAQRQQAFLFRMLAKQSETEFPIDPKIPLSVTVRFFHKGGKPGVPKRTIPDIDNLLKLTLDALTNAHVWRDDNQITKLSSEDLWAGPDGEARIEIEIEEHILPSTEPAQEQLQLGIQ